MPVGAEDLAPSPRQDPGHARPAVVRLHLSYGARPPWPSDPDGPGVVASFVELRLTPDALAAAVASWDHELAPFPVR